MRFGKLTGRLRNLGGSAIAMLASVALLAGVSGTAWAETASDAVSPSPASSSSAQADQGATDGDASPSPSEPSEDADVTATSATLANYYSDGMVFQRGKAIVIRGTADVPGAWLTITMKGNGHESDATVQADKDGWFEAKLSALPAGLQKYALTVSSGGNALVQYRSVYVGDVFIAAGQSNMMVNYAEHYETAADRLENTEGLFGVSDLPKLVNDGAVHYLRLADEATSEGHETTDVPLHTASADGWRTATNSGSKYLGYLPQLFAEQIASRDPSIPVGIIQTAWGGTDISRHLKGGDIYGNHIAPLAGLGVAGILWYQGESDATYANWAVNYKRNFTTLINQYRQAFGDADLPFLYVQIARYKNPYSAQIRQAQFASLSGVKNANNVAMTVSIDADEGTSDVIHPLGKDIIAKRMADQWVAMHAGAQVPSGPLADKAVSSAAGSVVVSFTGDTGRGLTVMKPLYSLAASPQHVADRSDEALTGFEVEGPDGVFVSASARIDGATVIVESDRVSDIRQIRYQYQNDPEVTTYLYNQTELPASPFVLAVQHADSAGSGTGDSDESGDSDAKPDSQPETGNPDSAGSSAVAWSTNRYGDTAVHRLYDWRTGKHGYSASASEMANMRNDGWVDEGTAFMADSTGVPVYRLYNQSTGDHYFTIDLTECDELESQTDWSYEGIAWKIAPNADVSVYRVYNSQAHEYMWTTDYSEYLSISGIVNWHYILAKDSNDQVGAMRLSVN